MSVCVKDGNIGYVGFVALEKERKRIEGQKEHLKTSDKFVFFSFGGGKRKNIQHY